MKEIGVANTKLSDKGAIAILFAAIKYSLLEVINFEGNNKIGFNTASFILQQLISIVKQPKIALREVFLEYTKVSSALRRSLEEALDSYQSGNFGIISQISQKYNSSWTYRSQPRQNALGSTSNKNSSRFAFANDFYILNERDSEISGTNRSKSAYKTLDKAIEDTEIKIGLVENSPKENIRLNRVSQNPVGINFRESNFLFMNRANSHQLRYNNLYLIKI